MQTSYNKNVLITYQKNMPFFTQVHKKKSYIHLKIMNNTKEEIKKKDKINGDQKC